MLLGPVTSDCVFVGFCEDFVVCHVWSADFNDLRKHLCAKHKPTFVGVSGGGVYFVVELVFLVVFTLLVSGGGVYLLVELGLFVLLVVLTVV